MNTQEKEWFKNNFVDPHADSCIVNNTCDDPACQTKALGLHCIPLPLFTATVAAVPGSKGTTYKASEIDAIVNATGVDCNYYVDFGKSVQGAPGDKITVGVKKGLLRGKKAAFSLFLFRGILKQRNPKSFTFYRGMAANPDVLGSKPAKTICFSVTDTLGNITYWDVTIRKPMVYFIGE